MDDPPNDTSMRTPIDLYACPSRRTAAADRNFDNNDQPPVVTDAAALGDYAANTGHSIETGMENLNKNDGSVSSAPVDTSVAGPIYSGSKISARRVIDGLSSTIAIGERHIPPVDETVEESMQEWSQGDTAFLAGDNRWAIFGATGEGLATGPDDPNHDKFGGPHPGVTLFAFLDGHVASIAADVDLETLMAMSTIAGGETVRSN